MTAYVNNLPKKFRKFTPADESILLSLIKAGPKSLTGKELEENANLSRQTINSRRDQLIALNLIKFVTKGKRTTYSITNKISNPLSFPYQVYRHELFNIFFSKAESFDSPFLITKFSGGSRLEESYFDFILRSGSFILYLLLQCMNPKFLSVLLKGNMNGDLANKILTSKRLKNYYISTILKNLVIPRHFLEIFRNELYIQGCNFLVDTAPKNEARDYSSLELEEASLTKGLIAYLKLFPGISNSVTSLDTKIDEYRGDWIRTRERSSCKHIYQIFDDGMKRVYKCKNCSSYSEYNIADKIKSIIVLKCLNSKLKKCTSKNMKHAWFFYNFGWDLKYHYICPLCKKGIQLESFKQEKIEIVEEKVSIELGQGKIDLLQLIQYFFHRDPNLPHTATDFLEHYKTQYHYMVIKDEETFVSDVHNIFKILSEFQFIDLVTDSDSEEISYIRKLIYK